MFFLGLALLSVGVSNSTGVRGAEGAGEAGEVAAATNQVRASIHNGFWAWKGGVLCLLCVTTFVIPVPHLDRHSPGHSLLTS